MWNKYRRHVVKSLILSLFAFLIIFTLLATPAGMQCWVLCIMPKVDRSACYAIWRHGGHLGIWGVNPYWKLILGIVRPEWVVHVSEGSHKTPSIKLLKKPFETLDIVWLDLEGRDSLLDDDELATIANMNSLTNLYIGGTAVSDASIPMLASMKNLNYVDAENTKMTEHAIVDLIKLREPGNRMSLYLLHCKAHSDTFELLRSRPELHVEVWSRCPCDGALNDCPFQNGVQNSETADFAPNERQ